jgi:uncharacterized protein (TIGR03086 family)
MPTTPPLSAPRAVAVLSRALDQAGDVLADVHQQDLDRPTPCGDWDVRRLIGHLLGNPPRFVAMIRGEQPDWADDPEPPKEGWTSLFRSEADDLIHAWHQAGDDVDPGTVDWQTAEFAVHTWDLARATGQDRPLDPEIAERGFAFMSVSLTSDNRGSAFGPEVDIDDDAPIYDRLAALSGRQP